MNEPADPKVARSGPAREPPLVAFVRIEKTASATLIDIFRAQYGRDSCVALGSRKDRRAALENVKRLGRDPGQVRLCQGHVPFAAMWRHLPDHTRYITMLRDPLERTVSHYFHLMKAGAAGQLPRAVAKIIPPTGSSLTEALQSERFIPANLQARMLCDGPKPWDRPADSAMLEQAKQNLDRFAAVGLVERFDDSLALIVAALDLPPVAQYASRTVNPDRPALDDLDEQSLAALVRHNELDLELHAYARELVEERLGAKR